MNDWVNCLRLVAFGQSPASQSAQLVVQQSSNKQDKQQQVVKRASVQQAQSIVQNASRNVDVLLEKRTSLGNQATALSRTVDYVKSLENASTKCSSVVASAIGGTSTSTSTQSPAPNATVTDTHPALAGPTTSRQLGTAQLTTASQAAAAAASALAKTRQRQPSLLGSCKPQPPTDSPFIQAVHPSSSSSEVPAILAGNLATASMGQLDTLTPTVRGQLISTTKAIAAGNLDGGLINSTNNTISQQPSSNSSIAALPLMQRSAKQQPTSIQQATLDEEEENMLYCSIEDNPSEHNYRVKVIETELSLRCQLKCYQLTEPTTISQQYEQLGKFNQHQLPQPVIFYQLIIGPQELTLLNDYASLRHSQQLATSNRSQGQGLWSWPYQCIRRYGFDKDNCFMFEAGRKCTSGPGQFIVQTPKAYNIYQDVVKFVNELRTLSVPEAPNNSANISRQTNDDLVGHRSTVGDSQQARMSAEVQQIPGVTQIPVTWTPSHSQTNNNNSNKISQHATTVDSVDKRQQFFDTLRQLDSNVDVTTVSQSSASIKYNAEETIVGHQQHQQQTNLNKSTTSSSSSQNNNCPLTNCPPISTNSSPTSTSTSSSGSPSPSSRRSNSTTSVSCKADRDQSPKEPVDSQAVVKQCESATADETDESGYEQGDDSVDGSSSRFKALMSASNRKRQANDSLSSSASSVSSSSGGSPGQSVSRRSNINVGGAQFNSQGPSKRPPLNTTESPKTNLLMGRQRTGGSHTLGIHKLIHATDGSLTGEPVDDFETNLIRDVYSEITKLHAKFAVTDGSAEDSMSSNSSSESSEGDNSAGSTGNPEPMYTNLKTPDRKHSTELNDIAGGDAYDDEDDDDEERENRPREGRDSSSSLINKFRPTNRPLIEQYQQRSQQHISYLSNNYDNNYLSSPRSSSIFPNGQLNPIPECREVGPPQPPPKPKNSLTLSSGGGGIAGQLLGNRQDKLVSGYKANAMDTPGHHNQKQSPGLNKSKLPTNHYVINDVQYAKISRNIRANY